MVDTRQPASSASRKAGVRRLARVSLNVSYVFASRMLYRTVQYIVYYSTSLPPFVSGISNRISFRCSRAHNTPAFGIEIHKCVQNCCTLTFRSAAARLFTACIEDAGAHGRSRARARLLVTFPGRSSVRPSCTPRATQCTQAHTIYAAATTCIRRRVLCSRIMRACGTL